MWKTDEFEYVWEEADGEHVWHVAINYQEGYEGNSSGSHDDFYEDLQDEYEIVKVILGEKRAAGYERTVKTVYDTVEIDDVMEKKLIEYYIAQQEGKQ